jgi:hypothetical protein
MKKTVIYTAVLSLLYTAAIPAYSVSADIGRKYLHIDDTEQFPQSKATNFRHTFELHIPQSSNALSQLRIQVPPGLTVKNNISIYDQSGQEINANVSVEGRQIIIAFPEPITSGTELDINMNQVRRSGVSNAWRYRVSAKFIGNDAEVPIGVAAFRVY